MSTLRRYGASYCHFGFVISFLDQNDLPTVQQNRSSFQLPPIQFNRGVRVSFDAPATYGEWYNPTLLSVDPVKTGGTLVMHIAVINGYEDQAQQPHVSPQYVDSFVIPIEIRMTQSHRKSFKGVLNLGNQLSLIVSTGPSSKTVNDGFPTNISSSHVPESSISDFLTDGWTLEVCTITSISAGILVVALTILLFACGCCLCAAKRRRHNKIAPRASLTTPLYRTPPCYIQAQPISNISYDIVMTPEPTNDRGDDTCSVTDTLSYRPGPQPVTLAGSHLSLNSDLTHM